MSFRIKKVLAREILDSRGNPTVECDVFLQGSVMGRAAVPSGASTGKHEAHELRDGGRRFHGLGVLTAVRNINEVIAKKIAGLDCRKQQQLDGFLVKLDGSENKSLLGANAILAVSLAAARAAAMASRQPLYRYLANSAIAAVATSADKRHRNSNGSSNRGSKNNGFILPIPFCNVINGGKHAGSSLKIQEFMVVPAGFDSFKEAITAVSEVYHGLKSLLQRKFGKPSVNVGDEGGFAPQLSSAEAALSLLESAVATTGYSGKIRFAIDAAASEFYNSRERMYEAEAGRFLTAAEMIDYYVKIAKDFPIVSVEDPFEQESFSAFAELTKKLAMMNVQTVGDDLLVTNIHRIREAVRRNSCNCLLLKVNQIGTLTEAVAAATLATGERWNVMVSHRSGETEDTFISDLAVALGCGQIKSGAPARTERTAKYNRLIRIEEELAAAGKKHSYGVM
ncbi:phosphopyruvate hydratase [Candidatus Woesearchaeota archaeon]|nr:phosphopyruvate hydratase [Candidatus Woesearchaeota archaeon]